MEKIKTFITNHLESEQGKDVLVVLIVILVGLGSFELGRLSKTDNSSNLKILYPNRELYQNNNPKAQISTISENTTENRNSNLNSFGKKFFASTKGSKYYSISCSAGKTIKLENRIYFATGEEAVSAGYELSSSCQ